MNFIITPQVLEELNKLKLKGGKTGRYAEFALNLVKQKCRIIDFPTSKGKSVDETLIEASIKLNAIIATLDYELRKKLRKIGKSTITLRKNRVYYE